MPTIELRADLNTEDNEGRWWSLLRDAVDPTRIVPGAVVVAGTDRYWATVRIDQVDDDGQVHFVAVDGDANFYRSSTGSDETGRHGEVRDEKTSPRNPSSEAQPGTPEDGPEPRSDRS